MSGPQWRLATAGGSGAFWLTAAALLVLVLVLVSSASEPCWCAEPNLSVTRRMAAKLLAMQHIAQPAEPTIYIRGLGSVANLSNSLLGPNIEAALKVKFSIYTRTQSTVNVQNVATNKDAFYELDTDRLAASGFDVGRRTIVLVPGYLTSDSELWIESARKLWLELADCNVIAVAWDEANKGLYWKAVADTPIVARQITLLLHYLAQLFGASLRDDAFLARCHLVGHSLGAHIAGFVGKDLAGRLGRITGLDPAGPTFDQLTDAQRLARTDAQFVDALHTNKGRMRYMNVFAKFVRSLIAGGGGGGAGGGASDSPMARKRDTLYRLAHRLHANQRDLEARRAMKYGDDDTAWFGIAAQIGHVDYYANNGSVQPGCDDSLHVCDHSRATRVYVDILRYELALRVQYAPAPAPAPAHGDAHRLCAPEDTLDAHTKATLNQSRLAAFEMKQYGSFLTGESFQTKCAVVLDWRQHLQAQDRGLNKCAVPIDFVTPTERLIDEFELVYGIPIRTRATAPQQSPLEPAERPVRKFYFKTSSGLNLMGDHYLLKIYLAQEPEWEENLCRLEVGVEMADGSWVPLKVRRFLRNQQHQLAGVASASGAIVALPFVNPAGASARITLNSVLQGDQSVTVDEIKLVQSVLPRQITLSANTVPLGLSGAPAAAADSKHAPPPGSCSLRTRMIEVHPVSGYEHSNFAGLYAARVFLKSPGVMTMTRDQPAAGAAPQPLDAPHSPIKVLKIDDFEAQERASGPAGASAHAPLVAHNSIDPVTSFQLTTIIYS